MNFEGKVSILLNVLEGQETPSLILSPAVDSYESPSENPKGFPFRWWRREGGRFACKREDFKGGGVRW